MSELVGVDGQQQETKDSELVIDMKEVVRYLYIAIIYILGDVVARLIFCFATVDAIQKH